jgi:pimeloyl-ACP methyl ester carboxylesterase
MAKQSLSPPRPLLLFLTALAVVAGLSIVPAGRPAQAAGRSESGPAVIQASGGCSGWAGTWSTDYGTMQLSVSGSAVTGTYDYMGGKISGKVSGNTLTGTWSQQPSYKPPNDAGDLQFTLAPGGNSFSGLWRYGSSGDWATWNGACVAGPSGGSGSTAPPTPRSGPPCQGSQLILLQGLSSESSDAPAYFGDIEAAVRGQVPYTGRVYFSYNPDNPQSYTVQDSMQAVSRSVEALHRTVTRLISQCDGVTIDLIGHSMGGVVALRYLSMYGPNTSEGGHIRHLITLDSPLDGISPDEVSTFVQTAVLLGIDLSSLQSSDAVRDLIAAYNDPGTPQRNASLARALSSNVVIGTFGSDDDLIVPYAGSIIPGYQSEWALGTISNLCPTYADACVGHNQILHDPGVLAQIVSLLRSSPGS